MTVHLDERLAEAFEGREVHDRSVDAGAALAAGENFAEDDKLVVRVDFLCFEKAFRFAVLRNAKCRFDGRLFRSVPDRGNGRLSADDGPERSHQHGLSRSGLSGYRGKSLPESKRAFLDQGEISDDKLFEHTPSAFQGFSNSMTLR